MSSVDRGTKFELTVAGILHAKGYSVKHNVNMIGKSGAAHQIDVLAEYKCPLHTDRIIVETKNYGQQRKQGYGNEARQHTTGSFGR